MKIRCAMEDVRIENPVDRSETADSGSLETAGTGSLSNKMIGSDDVPLPALRRDGNDEAGDENSTEIETERVTELECQQKAV
jgi:hypothetical protein